MNKVMRQKYKIYKILTLLLVYLSVSPQLYAQELNEGYAPIRAMGMGGASTAVGNDENSLWANPAGLARIRKARSRNIVHAIAFPNAILGINSSARSFNDSINAAKSSDEDLVNTVINQIGSSEDLADKAFWVRAALNPLLILEVGNAPLAFGAFTNTTSKVYLDSSTPSSARVEVISDSGVNLGYVISNRSNRLNLGLQFRPAYRYSFDDNVEVATLLDTEAFKNKVESGSNKGFGLGMDLGLLWTLADFWYPTLGVAVKNIPTGCIDDYLNPFAEVRQKVCGTTYNSGTINNSDALSIIDPMDLRIGLSISPRLSRDLGLRFSVDAHHLHFAIGDSNYGLSEIETLKLLHAGVELFWGNPLETNPMSVRIGVNQGFITTGASLRTSYFTLEFASYGQDISTTSSPNEDRRYLVSLSFNL